MTTSTIQTSHELSPEQLANYLDRRAEVLLREKRLYDIGNYGWLDQDNVDPAHAGHAMWQTDPPVEVDWEFLFNGAAVSSRPTENQKTLIVAGHDFEGVMRAARVSIGLCLIHEELALKAIFSENHYFWIHQMHAVLLLNIASDRIREYFVVAMFKCTADAYKRNGKKTGWFVTPFVEAREKSGDAPAIKEIDDLLKKMPQMANQVFQWREQRNSITHEISSRLARRQKEVIDRQQQAFDDPSTPNFAPDPESFEEMRRGQERADKEHQKEILDASNWIADWYRLLVDLSNAVFECEHRLREPNQSKLYRS